MRSACKISLSCSLTLLNALFLIIICTTAINVLFYSFIEGAKEGGGFGSRFMRGKTAISQFTGKKLLISRNLMNSFLTV